MGPFSTDPGTGGTAPTGSPAPAWAGQATPAEAPQAAPAWAGQPGAPQGAPTWLGQSGALPAGVTPTVLERGPQWPALRFVARWLKIVAWIGLVVGFFTALGLSIGLGSVIGGWAFFIFLFGLVMAALEFMLTYASAELILVLLAIEKNTRKNG